MNGKIRLGIMGFGNIGSHHGENLMKNKCPDLVLPAVADMNPKRHDFVRQKYPNANIACFSIAAHAC